LDDLKSESFVNEIHRVHRNDLGKSTFSLVDSVRDFYSSFMNEKITYFAIGGILLAFSLPSIKAGYDLYKESNKPAIESEQIHDKSFNDKIN